jgi:hypothetical protein
VPTIQKTSRLPIAFRHIEPDDDAPIPPSLSLAAIEQAHRAAALERTSWLDAITESATAAEIVAQLQRRNESQRNFSTMNAALSLCRDLLMLHTSGHAPTAARVRAIVAYVCERYIGRGGAIVEYDRCAWMSDQQVWFTMPWGTAFHGNTLVDVYESIGDVLRPSEREQWQQWLRRIGNWVCSNPVVDTIVFNCGVELLRLCWRLGQVLDRPAWSQWALSRMDQRLERDADDDGLFHAENGGVSGFYQLIGLRFLARFAWESDSDALKQIVLRATASAIDWSTPTLVHPGNFGTRTSRLARLNDEVLVAAAAFGDSHAAHLVRRHGQPGWSRDLALWRQALATTPRPRPLPAIRRFHGIDATVFRHGPFIGWVSNYPSSRWARGFINLWHRDAGDMIFSTLHSLPTPVEWAKLNLQQSSDWAAFPHVRVRGDAGTFDSQQGMARCEVVQDPDGITLSLDETLRSQQDAVGGRVSGRYRFGDDGLSIHLELSELAGQATVSFHILRRRDRFAGFWDGENVERVLSRQLADTGGWPRDRSLDLSSTGKVGIQIDQVLYVFELAHCPPDTRLEGRASASAGLHTDNHGGLELRLELPPQTRACEIALSGSIVPLTPQDGVAQIDQDSSDGSAADVAHGG